jgi:hypothetical protein
MVIPYLVHNIRPSFHTDAHDVGDDRKWERIKKKWVICETRIRTKLTGGALLSNRTQNGIVGKRTDSLGRN